MINVELAPPSMASVSITLDAEGREELLRQLDFLQKAPDHLHLWSESWVGAGGADLSELLLSGEGFCWCHELSIGLVEDDYFADEREASAFVAVDGGEGMEISLQVALTFTASGLRDFGTALRESETGAVCRQYPAERLCDGERLADCLLDCHIRCV